MSLAGYLSEYSVAEIFHFVQEGNKTGLLSIEPERDSVQLIDRDYYISFQGGRIMSVTNGLKDRSLLKTIEQRKWLSPEQMCEIEVQIDILLQPFGTYLKAHNFVNAEQLKLLFNHQVISNISKLFKIHHGRFKFDPKASLTYADMTGLSLTAKEAALLGLRVLKDWSGLNSKLPAPDSALQRLSSEFLGLRLDTQEWQVWQLALGEIPISTIATTLELDVEKVRHIGFRLSSVGLVQEISIQPIQSSINKKIEAPTPICVGGGNANARISASFLGNLIGFLKKKGE